VRGGDPGDLGVVVGRGDLDDVPADDVDPDQPPQGVQELAAGQPARLGALATPELAGQAAQRSRLHACTRRLVAAGVASGEFDADPAFVGHAISGLTLEAARERSLGAAPPGRGLAVADFVLRAVLAEPASLAAVRSAAAPLRLLL